LITKVTPQPYYLVDGKKFESFIEANEYDFAKFREENYPIDTTTPVNNDWKYKKVTISGSYPGMTIKTEINPEDQKRRIRNWIANGVVKINVDTTNKPTEVEICAVYDKQRGL
jgi:hypothetical protein